MADPKKNPLIGAFRTPVPNTPPNTPTPPAEQPPPSTVHDTKAFQQRAEKYLKQKREGVSR